MEFMTLCGVCFNNMYQRSLKEFYKTSFNISDAWMCYFMFTVLCFYTRFKISDAFGLEQVLIDQQLKRFYDLKHWIARFPKVLKLFQIKSCMLV